jgi:hypothetical protein
LKLQTIEPSRNGKHDTFHEIGEVPQVAPQPRTSPQTVFLDDHESLTFRSLIYRLSRFLVGGAPAARFITYSLAIVGITWGLARLPGGWYGAAFLFALVVAQQLLFRNLRKRDFVGFEPSSVPSVTPKLMPPPDKIALYATGLLSVVGKQRRYTWVPGFYRTFATGEHAVMCLVRDRRFLGIGQWPEDEVGMWYAFFEPRAVRSLEWGLLHYGSQPMTAISVFYELRIPASSPNKPDRIVMEKVYLAFPSDVEARTVLADLLEGLPPGLVPPHKSSF